VDGLGLIVFLHGGQIPSDIGPRRTSEGNKTQIDRARQDPIQIGAIFTGLEHLAKVFDNNHDIQIGRFSNFGPDVSSVSCSRFPF
jgi:hypothetical protein